MRVCQATHPIFSYRWLTRYQICRQNFHLCFIVYEWAIKRCRNPVHWCIFAKDSETGKGLILKVSIISSSGWGTHQFRIMIFKGHIIRLRTRKCNPFGNWFWGCGVEGMLNSGCHHQSHTCEPGQMGSLRIRQGFSSEIESLCIASGNLETESEPLCPLIHWRHLL